VDRNKYQHDNLKYTLVGIYVKLPCWLSTATSWIANKICWYFTETKTSFPKNA